MLLVLGIEIDDDGRKTLRRRIAGSAAAKTISRKGFVQFIEGGEAKQAASEPAPEALAALPLEVRLHVRFVLDAKVPPRGCSC